MKPIVLDDALSRVLEWGLVRLSDVVDGDVEVGSAARRNLNLRVERRRSSGFLVKQPDPAAPQARRTLQAEALFYAFCEREPRAAPVARLLPTPRLDVAAEGVLVLELVAGARSLWSEYEKASDQTPVAPARALGCALGTFHSAFPVDGLGGDRRLKGLGEGLADCLSYDRPYTAELRQLSPAQLEICRLLQSERSFVEGLARARRDWRTETLIHGDVRSDNVLVIDGPAPPRVEVRIVDWELVRRGDPAWDIGCALEDLVLFWTFGMSLRPDLETAERLATAKRPWPRVRSACGELWRAYLDALGPDGTTDLGARAANLAAARLVQSAWEFSSRLDRLSSLAVLLLQVSANVFEDPETAARDFFGLTLPAGEAESAS